MLLHSSHIIRKINHPNLTYLVMYYALNTSDFIIFIYMYIHRISVCCEIEIENKNKNKNKQK